MKPGAHISHQRNAGHQGAEGALGAHVWAKIWRLVLRLTGGPRLVSEKSLGHACDDFLVTSRQKTTSSLLGQRLKPAKKNITAIKLEQVVPDHALRGAHTDFMSFWTDWGVSAGRKALCYPARRHQHILARLSGLARGSWVIVGRRQGRTSRVPRHMVS